MSKIDLTLRIDADLLGKALAAGLEPADLLESVLASQLATRTPGISERGDAFDERESAAEALAARWAAENADAIGEHNESIARRGLIGAEWRRL